MRAFAFGLALAAGPAAVIANEQNPAVLDSDEKVLFPELKDASDISDRAAGILGSKDFKLVKVETIDGQNPFDPIEPFFNLNGVRVQNFAELLALLNDNDDDDNNNNNNAFAGCIGTFTAGQVLILGNVFAELSILINEAQEACTVFFNTNGESLGLIMEANDNVLDAFAFGGFTLLQPANGQLGFGRQVVRTRNNATGTVFAITMNLVRVSADPPSFTMTILEIVQE